MIAVARRLQRHLENLLTYLKHRITNAVTEGLNSKIQRLKSAARGFRKVQNYYTRIRCFYGKPDLYPLRAVVELPKRPSPYGSAFGYDLSGFLIGWSLEDSPIR
jgi:hypothetical protein